MRFGGLILPWLIITAIADINYSFVAAAAATVTNGSKGGSLSAQELPPAVSLQLGDKHVVMNNGILQVTLAVPEGYVTGISFNGVDNLLETNNAESNRGYWDAVWDAPGRCHSPGCTDWLLGTSFDIINESENQTEISFSSKWDMNSWNTSGDYPRLPINVDRRYVMLRGLSGFYSYAILDREEELPESNIYQIRAVYKLHRDRFHYMAISDERQRIMPMPQDRDSGQPLAYKEAVLLTNPINSNLRGEA